MENNILQYDRNHFNYIHSDNFDIVYTDSFAKLRIYSVHKSSYGGTSKKLIEATQGVNHNEMTYDFIMQQTKKYNFFLPSLIIEVKDLVNEFKACTK